MSSDKIVPVSADVYKNDSNCFQVKLFQEYGFNDYDRTIYFRKHEELNEQDVKAYVSDYIKAYFDYIKSYQIL